MAGIPYKEFEDTDFMYRMRSGHKGIAIIINNEKFDCELNVVDRLSSLPQLKSLRSALSYIGYKDIRIYTNLTGKEICQLLKTVVDKDYRSRRMDSFSWDIFLWG
ncbi:hypothetical protein EB796_003573 [Bugula neritina]|uniref:Caspase family p20 domain-containing protein n=1 Tax=Bugula neritina TaxID=10212 RepID=A0A7J7KIR6_BUGNE|nr:hypothetical protein EB796_003573 [Bugula neritina]